MLRTATALALVAIAVPADAGTVSGRVVSASGAEAAPIPGVWVWFESSRRTRTDAEGRFELEIPDRPGIVWARVPDGYQPGRAFEHIGGPTDRVEIALTPSTATGALRFVHVSDAHIGKRRYGPEASAGRFDAGDLAHALDQALAHDPADPPAFYVMTGDLTNRETRSEIAEAAGVLLDRGVPFVPVPGNHDWVARGERYRATFGPPNYSFDAGGVHFVVLNDNWRRPPNLKFLQRDLETVADSRQVIAFVHRPPRDEPLWAMERMGVDVLFTGHWHSNRYVDIGDLRQINTQAIVRGGIDFTPAGYRIVTVEDGSLSIVHGTVIERPRPALAWPPGGGCVAGDQLEIITAIEPRALGGRQLSVAIDGGPRRQLEHRGAWAFTAPAGDLTPGAHSAVLRSGGQVVGRGELAVCAERPTPETAPWLQAQGGPAHRGRSRVPIQPPLRGLWAAALGEHLLGGSPAVAGDLVLVPSSDLDDGDGGGVVALALATGAVRWRATTGHSVRGTPAVGGELAVFGDASGVVHAVALATGEPAWTTDLGAGVDNTRSALVSAPAVAGGRVYAVIIGRIAALDLGTGEILWEDRNIGGSKAANMSSRAAPAVQGDLVVATAGWGKGGLVAFDADTGERRWSQKASRSHGINGSPIIAGGQVFVADAKGHVRALDRDTGQQLWTRRIAPHANSLSLSVAATPAIAGEILVVPTQYHSLIALDAGTGEPLWRAAVDPANVHTAHDQRTAPSVTGSPVIAGDLVWFAGADGVLRAVELASGAARHALDLGAPVLAGPAPAGELLIVAGYDGVVRALVSAPLERPVSTWLIAGLLVFAGVIGWGASARGTAA